MKSAKQVSPNFHIFFDTNTIFVDGFNDFVNRASGATIAEIQKTKGVQSHWYLPEIVREERQFQMETAVQPLFGQIAKAEKFLGRQFNVTQEDIQSAIKSTIQRQIDQYEFIEIAADTKKVNWNDLIRSAVRREPPFQLGEKEKGFRDAVILETFVQFAPKQIKSNSSSRVVLISNDRLLREAVEKRLASVRSDRLRIFESLSQALSAVNAEPAHLDVEQIESLLTLANLKFYDLKNNGGLYVTSNIETKISSDFAALLSSSPSDDTQVARISLARFEVSPAVFLGKNGSNFSFKSEVTAVMQLEPSSVASYPISTVTSPQLAGFSPSYASTGSTQGLTIVTTGSSARTHPTFSSLTNSSGFASAPLSISIPSITGSTISVTAGGANGNTMYFLSGQRRELLHRFDVIWTADLVNEDLVNLKVSSIKPTAEG